MQEKLIKLKEVMLSALAQVSQLSELESFDYKYLGRKGELSEFLKTVAGLSLEEKKTVGKLANDIKKEFEAMLEERRNDLLGRGEAASPLDVSLPGARVGGGHLHPMTLVQTELEDLFSSLGFAVLDGPELESDFYNFEALNIPAHHPARDMQDTFYVNKKNTQGDYDMVMRTHTSPMQVRAMRKYGAPLRCVIPGRCFRSEATDARHEHTFYQIEGIMLDNNISLADMKGVLETLVQSLYGKETKLRLRPKFYPFVEPGSNIEITCFLCSGEGCRVCKKTGWLEVGGCGLVHPNVLRYGQVDPEKYQGFAFGFGLTRLAMLKYGINDVRLMQSDDLRFLEQF
jgi:phenylalanyl-tRNA synthetase alpha chain